MDVSFCGRHCFSAVSHPQQYSIATRDTVVPMNIEVMTKYPLSHNDRIVVLEIRLHCESPMLYRPALHDNWSALSLARRALKENIPHAKDTTHSCVPKSSGISAGPCIWHLVYWQIVQESLRRITLPTVLKMEAEISSEMSVTIYLLTQRHIREDFTLHHHSCRNLRSQKEGRINFWPAERL